MSAVLFALKSPCVAAAVIVRLLGWVRLIFERWTRSKAGQGYAGQEVEGDH